ncbi:hypothetical protein ACQX9V_001424 [Escherichia coli]
MKKLNISLDDIFGDKIKEMRERDKEFIPDVTWFAKMDIERMNTYMTKYLFNSFEEIPQDNSGLSYPEFENIDFKLPDLLKPESIARLPLKFQKKPIILYVDGILLLRNLGKGAFCIDPRRWHRIKTYISKGTVIYPEGTNDEFGISDGRHRTLLLMQLYKRRTIPVVIDERNSKKFIENARKINALVE